MNKNEALETTLWDPSFESDACGMGFVAHIDGQPSHTLVEYALTMLERMNHRGGTGAEPDTGDGAGILLAMPHEFFVKEAEKSNTTLPQKGDYAVGQFFLPKDNEEKNILLKEIDEVFKEENIEIIFTREVPFIFGNCGPTSQKIMPSFLQYILKRPTNIEAGRSFEDKLFIVRRILEKTFENREFYICSLSSKTIVYKGMLHAYQVGMFYPDLKSQDFKSHIALTHSRFSTNTFPSWDRAQPFRYLAHNGEINTLRGAENWMVSNNIEIYNKENSDSAKLENCMEYLYQNGRDIPHSLLMMIPEAASKEALISDDLAAFYDYTSSFMAPWDGPAALVFTDGDTVGARLDRNGLRPSRYSITSDRFIICSSESGVVDLEPSRIVEKGVLGPGNMMLIDTINGHIIRNEEVKEHYSKEYPYQEWVKKNMAHLSDLTDFDLSASSENEQSLSYEKRQQMWKQFGYTDEVVRQVIIPMAENGQEPTVSMGYDSPLAVLSKHNQSLYTFFKQQFAQVTNPPIDAIREKIVISTDVYLGCDSNITQDTASNCKKLKLDNPVLSTEDFNKISHLDNGDFKSKTISTLYDVNNSLSNALENLFKEAEMLVDAGTNIIVLSDREFTAGKTPMPILLAASGLYHYMVEQNKGKKFSIVVDTAEVTEVHHFAVLIGYGVCAIHPYGAYETLVDYGKDDLADNYRQAASKGIVKVMSRMGISTILGYKGAQLFEAVGLSDSVVEKYFTGTVTRLSGLSIEQIDSEYKKRTEYAYSNHREDSLPSGGSFQFKEDGEHHLYNPKTMYTFQQAVRLSDYEKFKEYSSLMDEEAKDNPTTLRSLWEFKGNRKPLNIEEVEPVDEIVKRFKVGAMSFGSLSQEAHECLAEAMNSIGAKSNCGEGGENANRFKPQADGRNVNSKIKQVASGRFGVNAAYLMSAEEIQIKLAQGAKPGEGGQLPGRKSFPWVAEIRGSTPGVTLISPPPHHDIYSIEDLAQLIYDLKAINPYAKINVKLVSSTGVGTIATGCVKAGADKVVISGYDGGTGASPRNSVRDAGLPWEIGLSEAHQTLHLNNLRQRVTLETDGKLMTGRDIAVAALLGAEEYSFASLPLVAIGCVMMRVCSLNTCPVGVATQDPRLRAHFAGKPGHVVNTMKFLAQELREIMADLGFSTVDEMVGHTEVLKQKIFSDEKINSLDFSRVIGSTLPIRSKKVDPFEETRKWVELDSFAQAAIENGQALEIKSPINNVNRSVGSRMGGWIAERYGNYTLPIGQIKYQYTGVAGQSFASFITQGMELTLVGEANDYIAKSLSGGRVIVRPPHDAGYDVGNTPIVGNVACFGAVRGEAYFRGRAGERFCVRNSGAHVVVEGIGDHGCEYMTGGVAVILGTTGRNFAAGMSGGVAYVYDEKGDFDQRVNHELVDLYRVDETIGDEILKELIENHYKYTESDKAKEILENWDEESKKFIKVYPTEYHEIKAIEYKLKSEGVNGVDLTNQTFNLAMTMPKEEKYQLIKVRGGEK
ncbi:glutamate synthase large subunit [Floricoccus penangensis]|uniref:glutamate synthase large subunit n=1 Tax=Floricoccus penangensis TaxID=1859475 RepID=UPI00203AE423|nr:glutamate synthase large subunit [Floricoccus penangensis]URZ87780.1 glutamate synthase large subunit [Floricoccus penangensis]